MFEAIIVNPVQVKYVRTVVGWWNVYLADSPGSKTVNLSPEQFRLIFPGVSPKARLGCGELDRTLAQNLFGSLVISKIA